jgi:carboxyl-terminal processing protease
MIQAEENFAQTPLQSDSSVAQNLDIFTSVYRKVINGYPDTVSPRKLMLAGMHPMLESIDPYTHFFTESEAQEFKTDMKGKFGGTGMILANSNEGVLIEFTFAGFPASRAGLRAADLILEINGTSTKKKSLEEVMSLLRGVPGTDISITVHRPGEAQNITRSFKREVISLSPVSYYGMLNNEVAYIRLTRETEDCSKDVEAGLNELNDKYHFKGIVLDLRGNEGGYFDEAVKVANLFVEKGNLLVTTRGRDKETSTYAEKVAAYPSIPLAVLTDNITISSGEILSGALQDNDRAVLIGQRTFGKGLVQVLYNMPEGTLLMLTTGHYYTPSGRCIQAFDYVDGKSNRVADSIKNVFKTKNGRDVYSNGGISPDISMAYHPPSTYLQNMIKDRIIFDFSTQYKITHASIDSPTNFTLTEDEYTQFMDFVKVRNFTYISETDNKLNAAKETAEKEGYWTAIQNDFLQLENNLSKSKEQELITNKEEIKKALQEEIVSRYYYENGRYEAILRNDNEVKKAVEILMDRGAYMKLLH